MQRAQRRFKEERKRAREEGEGGEEEGGGAQSKRLKGTDVSGEGEGPPGVTAQRDAGALPGDEGGEGAKEGKEGVGGAGKVGRELEEEEGDGRGEGKGEEDIEGVEVEEEEEEEEVGFASGGQPKLKRVPTVFSSTREYVDVFEPLILEECRAQIVRAPEEGGEAQGRPLAPLMATLRYTLGNQSHSVFPGTWLPWDQR